jgi:hypothetical protein
MLMRIAAFLFALAMPALAAAQSWPAKPMVCFPMTFWPSAPPIRPLQDWCGANQEVLPQS